MVLFGMRYLGNLGEEFWLRRESCKGTTAQGAWRSA